MNKKGEYCKSCLSTAEGHISDEFDFTVKLWKWEKKTSSEIFCLQNAFGCLFSVFMSSICDLRLLKCSDSTWKSRCEDKKSWIVAAGSWSFLQRLNWSEDGHTTHQRSCPPSSSTQMFLMRKSRKTDLCAGVHQGASVSSAPTRWSWWTMRWRNQRTWSAPCWSSLPTWSLRKKTKVQAHYLFITTQQIITISTVVFTGESKDLLPSKYVPVRIFQVFQTTGVLPACSSEFSFLSLFCRKSLCSQKKRFVLTRFTLLQKITEKLRLLPWMFLSELFQLRVRGLWNLVFYAPLLSIPLLPPQLHVLQQPKITWLRYMFSQWAFQDNWSLNNLKVSRWLEEEEEEDRAVKMTIRRVKGIYWLFLLTVDSSVW